MLTRLYISNYALIDRLEVDFEQGLTIITGETGAGKSIILGALSLILGGRADSASIRNREAKTIVEASFRIPDNDDVRRRIEESEIELEGDDEIIVRREISANGRSRVFVNDGVTSVTELRDIMARMVDIHSQHNNMLLAQPAFQLDVLDSFAGNKTLLDDYRQQYLRYRQALKALNDFNDEYDRSIADLAYITFQFKQLDQMMLRENEDDDLEAQHRVLSNASDIREALWTVESLLNGDEHSVITDLNTVTATLERTQDNMTELAGMADRVRSALIELKDIAQSVSILGAEISDDPERLQRVEHRLNEIFDAQRKFKASNVNELIAIRDNYERQIENVKNFDDRHEELEMALQTERQKAADIAGKISATRRKAAETFISLLKPQARSLGMKNLEFDVEFITTDLSERGTDAVQFRFAFNKNQELMPVKDTASGGEISRLMLCVKSIIARKMNLPTIIFDEVDTGVSGEIAAKMGEMMDEIAHRIQVLSITHLPQVAAYADHHLRVYKHDTSSETVTAIEALDTDQHVTEVARMLSAGDVNEAALTNARSLINAKQR